MVPATSPRLNTKYALKDADCSKHQFLAASKFEEIIPFVTKPRLRKDVESEVVVVAHRRSENPDPD